MSSLESKIKAFKPDIIIAIGGGGFIPARMIRSLIKVPILAVSLELYDDSTCTMRSKVEKRQWFDEATSLGKLVRGGRVLVVDEVDDTRTTLQYCLEELMETNAPAAVAVAVVHNKLKKKTGRLPAHVQYFAGEEVEDKVKLPLRTPPKHDFNLFFLSQWNCYPWDACSYGNSIDQHEALAHACSGGNSTSSPFWSSIQSNTALLSFVTGLIAGAALLATATNSIRT
jgi:hypoxanthine phosphoribosyltransferase